MPVIADVQLHLTVDGAARAAQWYQDAFGAVEVSRITLPDDRLIHLHMVLGGLTIMFADEFPEVHSGSPKTLGGTYGAVYLFFDDVNAAWERAVGAGAEVVRELADVFWGNRDGQLVDPFGHRWGMAQVLHEVPIAEMSRLAAAAFGMNPK